jgi:hypothetical protein
MAIHDTRRAGWRGTRAALQAATFIALIAGCGSPADEAQVSATASAAGVTQNVGDDPCRYATAEAVGKAFGHPMKSSKLANVCQYRGDAGMVVVKVEEGPEGTILRHARSASAQSQSGVEKIAVPAGDAYLDSTLPVFIGRVGNYEVQLETTIQPVPRGAMIAVGTRIMETLARK